MEKICCVTCGLVKEAESSLEGWQELLTLQGWEYHCPKCWEAFLARVEKERKAHAA